MKTILAVLFITLIPLAALADVPPSPPEPSGTGEAIMIVVGTIATVGNVMTIATKAPAYWLGSLGAAAGVTALVMRGQPDAVHESGLLAVGLMGLASGTWALRYRYVLNHEATQARIEPTWHEGSPGLAFVVDF